MLWQMKFQKNSTNFTVDYSQKVTQFLGYTIFEPLNFATLRGYSLLQVDEINGH